MGSRNGNRNGPGPVPDRWLRCPRKSVALVNGKFLVFKTPLSPKFDDQVPPEFRFPVDFVFASMKSYRVKIGLWIDLTNTSRFYDKSEVEENGCRYVKLQCKGRGETPNEEQTKLFETLCDNFTKSNPLEIIAVHCTHGFNRSGFLITSYLVENFCWGLDAALAEFAKCRPPGIYKKDYIDELYRRFDSPEDAISAPEMPEWCLEVEGEDSDGTEDYEETANNKRKGGDHSNNGGKNKKRRAELVKENPQFMSGVPGVTAVSQPVLGEIQRKVQQLCGWTSNGFPGCQPVSMDLENIKFLAESPYRVSWKADGTRYLMYIKDRNEVFFIDRDNSVFQVKNLMFPRRSNLNAHIRNTLLDGEMVIDKVNGMDIPRFLAYDVVHFDNIAVKDQPFYPSRYQTIAQEVVSPRHEALRQGKINRDIEPFSIRLKEFWDIQYAEKILGEKFSRNLCHEPDGLIFQPASEKYVTGRCHEVLKWKPSSLNSVDFKLKIKVEEGMGIVPKRIGELYVGGMETAPFAKLPTLKNVQHLNNKIIECVFANNQWQFLRERTDKMFPNSYDTAQAVCNSIKRPVTKEYLLDFIETSRYRELMPPPPPPGHLRHKARH